MRIDWKCMIVAMVVVSTTFAMSLMTVNAERGGVQGPGISHQAGSQAGIAGGGQHDQGVAGHSQGVSQAGSQGDFKGGAQHSGGGVQTGGGMGQAGQGQHTGSGMGQAGQGQHTGSGMGQAGQGQHTGGGMGERGAGEKGSNGRNFDRQSFFGGHDHNWWRNNHEHHYWNGNAWVFGVEPAGFIPVSVPVQSCPYTPEAFSGNPNTCFFSCVDNGYDPIGVCNICCGTNY